MEGRRGRRSFQRGRSELLEWEVGREGEVGLLRGRSCRWRWRWLRRDEGRRELRRGMK